MKKLFAVLLFCFSLTCLAEDDYQIWVPVNINANLTDHWRGFLEFQPRIDKDATKMGVGIIRPAIGYALDNHWTFWAGYLAQANSKTGDFDDYSVENRAFQGISYKDRYQNLIWEARNRLEERMFAENSDPGLRWRTRLRGEYLFDNCPVSIIASEEFFINFRDNSDPAIQTGMDQMRTYIGLAYRFAPQFQIETGYLQNHVWGNEYREDKNNNVWMSNLNINF